MVIQANAPPAALIAIGFAFLAGAAMLAWYSAVATLHLTRVASVVHVEIEDRLLGVVPIARERIEDVRSVSMASGRLPGDARSHTPDFLVFHTRDGKVDRGHSQQLFTRDFAEIRDFLADPSRGEIVLRSTGTASEFVRFVAAQSGVVFLTALGALLLYLGVRGVFADPNAGIGPV